MNLCLCILDVTCHCLEDLNTKVQIFNSQTLCSPNCFSFGPLFFYLQLQFKFEQLKMFSES